MRFGGFSQRRARRGRALLFALGSFLPKRGSPLDLARRGRAGVEPPGRKVDTWGMRRLPRTLIATAAALTTLTAAAAPAADAGMLVSTAQSCEAQTFSKPFSRWGDLANYTPVPGGAFEAGQVQWAMTGGAKVVSGNESFKVRSSTDSRSLYLPQGATATSPSICVGLSEPTLRWFQKQASLLGLTGAMTVEVLFENSLGQVMALPIGAGLLNSTWQPSLPGVVIANLLPLLPDNKTAVAFRFRAVLGNWWVDDAYVDPYRWS
jgi:hypothetical protein